MRQIRIIPIKKHTPISRLIVALVIAIVTATGLAVTTQRQSTSAASVSGFDPGNIMSDAVMSNKATMSQSQIQSFLNSKNTCKTNPKSPSGLTRINATKNRGELDSTLNGKPFTYKYYLNNGKFICLADQKFDNETAAQIIYRAAQDYSINPQVILVLLEKENSLLSDNWPNYNLQYNTATGYGCPDSGPNNSANCNANYFGFKNQIRNAANMFSTLLKGQGWNNFPVGVNYIQYNPSASCGGSNVNIKNRATGALYTYTPYQPNKGALAAGWGEAPCGAYGNRNFYLLFTQWFGSSSHNPSETAIANRYKNLSTTSKKSLGAATSAVKCGLKNNGCYQRYEGGAILWTASTGAWESIGSIRNYWITTGYEGGSLGYPTSGEVRLSSTGGWYQRYEHGYVIGKSTTGYWESKGSIRTRWAQLGYEGGTLGYPTGPETAVPAGGWQQNYEHGTIIGRGSIGYWESKGSIRTRWAQLGYEGGTLGYPTGPETAVPAGGWQQNYQNGTIMGKPGTGYWYFNTPILERHKKLGGGSGKLGYPVSSVKCSLIKDGCYQSFQKGVVLWTGATGAWESAGSIRTFWITTGWENGALGYPTGSEIQDPTGAWSQKYEKGTVRSKKGVSSATYH